MNLKELEENTLVDSCCQDYDIKKENIVIYTNCHGSAILKELNENKEIREKYNVHLILVYICKTRAHDIHQLYSIVGTASIFIYHSVYKDHETLSTYLENTNCILNKLKPECHKICISNPQNNAMYIHSHPGLSSYIKNNNIKNALEVNSFIQF
jgi:hypothetical protein